MGDISAELDTDYGRIKAGWRVSDGTAYYSFDVPRSTTLILPDGKKEKYPAGNHTAEYKLNNI